MKIEEIIIKEWEDLLKLNPEEGIWVYRGQSNTNWNLETSLFRTVAQNQKGYRNEGDYEDRLYAERAALKTFKARAHFYLNDLPSTEDTTSWLSVMQHHGTPTRLLDFTKSLYIALYFALIEATNTCCIWAINDNWLRNSGSTLAIKHNFKLKNQLRYGELDSIYDFSNYILNQNSFDGNEDEDFIDAGVLMIELKRQIPRLAVQQGIFLMPTALRKTFKENLSSHKITGYEPIIQKIIIPHKLKPHFLMHLKTMNITAESLFPGIDGFARSLIHIDM